MPASRYRQVGRWQVNFIECTGQCPGGHSVSATQRKAKGRLHEDT
jgi:hypothetical protein